MNIRKSWVWQYTNRQGNKAVYVLTVKIMSFVVMVVPQDL
jgi:hypothetical protein